MTGSHTDKRLIAVPNISEGRDLYLIERLALSFTGPDIPLLGIHSDIDHNRAVFTLAGEPSPLVKAMFEGTQAAVSQLSFCNHTGQHPYAGVVDVAPFVYLDESLAGSAAAAALTFAESVGSRLELPVFIYGELGGGLTRAEIRRGGPLKLAQRIASGELKPSFGPQRLHPTAGALMVTARMPLIAFNLELAESVTLAEAKRVAAEIRESAEGGLRGVRAIGLELESRGVIQLSTNIENYLMTSPADVVAAVSRRVPVVSAELVGLAPEAAFKDFPQELPLQHYASLESRLKQPPDIEWSHAGEVYLSSGPPKSSKLPVRDIDGKQKK